VVLDFLLRRFTDFERRLVALGVLPLRFEADRFLALGVLDLRFTERDLEALGVLLLRLLADLRLRRLGLDADLISISD